MWLACTTAPAVAVLVRGPEGATVAVLLMPESPDAPLLSDISRGTGAIPIPARDVMGTVVVIIVTGMEVTGAVTGMEVVTGVVMGMEVVTGVVMGMEVVTGVVTGMEVVKGVVMGMEVVTGAVACQL